MKQFVLVLLLVAVCGAAWAESAAVERRVDEMIQNQQAMQRRIEDLESRLQDTEDPAFRASLLNYEKDMLQLRNELRQASTTDLLPGWLTTDLNFEARVRVRYVLGMDTDRFYWGSNRIGVADGTPTRFINFDDDTRHRIQYMVYFGFSKNFGTDWSAGFRLASTVGGGNDRNITLGNAATGYFGEDEVGIDRAWIAWKPDRIGDLNTAGFEIRAGKFANPLVATDMLWDIDVSPEGVYETYRLERENLGGFVPFISMAQLIGQEMVNDADVTCQAYQVGFDWTIGNDVFKKLTMAFTYYDWEGYEDALNKNLAALNVNNLWPNLARITTVFGNTVSLRPTTNPATGAAAVEPYFDVTDFQIMNVTTFLDLELKCGEKVIPVQPFFDYAWNEGNAANAFPVLPGVAPAIPTQMDLRPNNSFGQRNQNDAIALGVRVGDAKEQGDMEFKYKYAHIETNSILGAFSDNNFGGANREGHVIEFKYMLHDNVWFGTALYLVRDIFDLDHTNTMEPELHVEFNVSF